MYQPRMAKYNASVKLAADSLSAEQKQHLHEVADEMLTIYQTLVSMRYIHPNALISGPHEISEELLATYKELDLDPAIIYLYSIMPYIDEIETDARDFFQGGAFFNQMSISHVQRGRDPRYFSPQGGFDDEEGQYMYPWYTPLSNCGNHSPIMIYDAKEHRIWIVQQVDPCSTDPVYCKGWYADAESEKGSNWGDSGESNWSEESAGEEEDADGDIDMTSDDNSEFWDDEDDIAETQELNGLAAERAEDVDYDEGFEHVEELQEWERQEAAVVKNRNSLEPIYYRRAVDVLRDINRWYRELKEVPGQGEYSGWMEPKILRPLYLKNGWPEDFDGDQFEVDVARAYATERARYDAEEPLRQVDCYAGWCEYSDRDIERHKKEISEAKTSDDEWGARFKLWQAEERSERTGRDLKNAREEADKKCPGGICQKDQDLPLWQLEKLRVRTQWKRERVQRTSLAEQHENDPLQIRAMESGYRRAQHELEVYEKAYEASRAEAERLCPGRTFQDATGIKSLGRQDTLTSIASQKKIIKYYEDYIQTVREFAETVPQDAPQAKATVQREIEQREKTLKQCRDRLERSEKWLAEHGNTD